MISGCYSWLLKLVYISYFFSLFSARRCQGDRSKKKPEKLQLSLFLSFSFFTMKKKLLSPTAVIQLHNVDIPQEVYRLCDALRLPSSYVSAKRMTKHPSGIEKATPKYLHLSLFILSGILSLYQNLQQKNFKKKKKEILFVLREKDIFYLRKKKQNKKGRMIGRICTCFLVKVNRFFKKGLNCQMVCKDKGISTTRSAT